MFNPVPTSYMPPLQPLAYQEPLAYQAPTITGPWANSLPNPTGLTLSTEQPAPSLTNPFNQNLNLGTPPLQQWGTPPLTPPLTPPMGMGGMAPRQDALVPTLGAITSSVGSPPLPSLPPLPPVDPRLLAGLPPALGTGTNPTNPLMGGAGANPTNPELMTKLTEMARMLGIAGADPSTPSGADPSTETPEEPSRRGSNPRQALDDSNESNEVASLPIHQQNKAKAPRSSPTESDKSSSNEIGDLGKLLTKAAQRGDTKGVKVYAERMEALAGQEATSSPSGSLNAPRQEDKPPESSTSSELKTVSDKPPPTNPPNSPNSSSSQPKLATESTTGVLSLDVRKIMETPAEKVTPAQVETLKSQGNFMKEGCF